MSVSTAYSQNYTVMKVSALAFAQTAPDIGIALDGTTPFSVDAWVRFNGLSASASILSQEGFFSFGSVGNTLMLELAGQQIQSDPSQQALDEEIWHYVCATFDGGSVRLYIDGEFNYMESVSGTAAANSNPFQIGNGLQALVKTVRVYNTPLDADTVLLNMFGEPSPSSIVAYFDFTQVPPIDRGSGQLPINLQNGAAMITSTPAMALSGTAYAQPFLDRTVNPGGYQVDQYTIQAWVYIESNSNPQQMIFVNSDLERDTGMALYLQYDDAALGFRVLSQRGANVTSNTLSSNSVVKQNSWVNVATTFDGTTLTIYIQGNSDASSAFGPIPLIREKSYLLIGAASSQGQPSGATALQGYVAQVTVWGQALTAPEIAQYISAPPDVSATGLNALYDFTSSPARNQVNGHPIGLADGAVISSQVNSAVLGPTTLDVATPPSTLDEAALQSIRGSLDFTDFLAEHGHLLEEAMEADVSAFKGQPEGQQRIRYAWRDTIDKLRNDPGSLRFMVTSHRIGDEHVMLCHTRGGTHVAFRAEAATFDDCWLWKIKLVFIIAAGILDALFGLKAVLNPKAQGYIGQILANARIASLMANGQQMAAGTIFTLASIMWKEGYFRELLNLIVQLGFWALLRVVAKMVLKLAGIGAADVIASLVATAAAFVYTYVHERPEVCDPLPTVDLAAIKFNYDPTGASISALSIRQNYLRPVTVPEWVKGEQLPENSPAAYSIAEVSGHPISLQARFTISTPTPTEVLIKADGGGILGAIAPTSVNFLGGGSIPPFVVLELPNHTIGAAGIQKQDIHWDWSYKIGAGNWTRIDTSSHRIYTVLGTPTAPWQQSDNLAETQLPWVDALEYACEWASEIINPLDGATVITNKVNFGLGLTYDMAQGISFYTRYNGMNESQFLCTDFLRFLKDGTGRGNKVNCTDCATIVSTFANLIGCNLTESTMYNLIAQHMSPFTCNKIIAIGQATWAYPFPPGNQFAYHEVAWAGPTGVTGNIFDACLEVDSSNNPWTNPDEERTAEVPINMVFTTVGIDPVPPPIPAPFTAPSYRERLAQNTVGGIGSCKPQGPTAGTRNGRRQLI